jgi:hypothetical protein
MDIEFLPDLFLFQKNLLMYSCSQKNLHILLCKYIPICMSLSSSFVYRLKAYDEYYRALYLNILFVHFSEK